MALRMATQAAFARNFTQSSGHPALYFWSNPCIHVQILDYHRTLLVNFFFIISICGNFQATLRWLVWEKCCMKFRHVIHYFGILRSIVDWIILMVLCNAFLLLHMYTHRWEKHLLLWHSVMSARNCSFRDSGEVYFLYTSCTIYRRSGNMAHSKVFPAAILYFL